MNAVIMGRFDTPKPLKDLLSNYIEDYPYKKRLKRGMVLSLWPQKVGDKINEHTKKVEFERDRLIVYVDNEVWRRELHMRRRQLKKTLNKEVKGEVVREIVVRS